MVCGEPESRANLLTIGVIIEHDSVGTGRSLPALLTPALAGERDAGRGKSELHRAVCRVTPGSGGFKAVRRTVPQKKYRLRKEVRVKRCGKSAPGVQ